MENIDFAKKFFQTDHINLEVQEEMDWDTLELWDTALLGEDGKQIYADVLYRVFTKDQQEAFIIFNHERKPDKILPVRRLEYKLGTLKKAIKQEKESALIYFITWYNGPAPYPYQKSIIDYFTWRQLAAKLFLEDEIIVVKEIPDEELSKHGEVSILEVFMKHVDNPNFPQWLIDHPEIAQQLAENKYIERSIEYLLEVGYHKEEDLVTAFEKTPKLKETMLTTRQRIEERGRQEGRQEEKLGIARNMFQAGEPIERVARWTGLSEASIRSL
jgi:predicted transposase/invertase (TIGR01784 family)